MKKLMFVFFVMSYLLICGGSNGDVMSSSTVCDGSYWTHSTAMDKNQTYKISIFTTNLAQIDREVQSTNGVVSSTMVNSSGSLGIDEYTNHLRNPDEIESPLCVFNPSEIIGPIFDEITVSGLLDNTEYISSRMANSDDKTSAKTLINGSGLIIIGKHSSNESAILDDLTSIHGKMKVLDYVEFGER
ncbi:MAG: hypothetical protein LUQ50_09240 [Methanospirillum sp.]|uniref:hypothetical protein n=1 Tax=Methanospirillum sp. TaxID=45200 RepID=UPI00236E2DB8|nr:hypothetical protein [Methanospirillum sp.]MDD1729243.1 hypothetical protein [Methanospirillum sp.]